MCGVCVGGGGHAFNYTYTYSQTGRPCEVAELVGVLVAETIHPACMCEEDAGGREAGAPSDLKMPLENGRADERVSRGQASERAVCVCVLSVLDLWICV